MLLTIDIGNSSTKIGIYQDDVLTKKLSIATDNKKSAADSLTKVEKELPEEVESIIITSVVNKLPASYKKYAKSKYNVTPVIINHKLNLGFSIKYSPPEDCGTDRLAAAFAATRKYGLPVVVCDIGTATTIDLVTENNEFVGGIIAPGPDTLGSALFDKTSRLPKIDFEYTDKIIGNSTISSIQSGIYFGYVGLIDGLIERILTEANEKPAIVSTGGFANTIAKKSKYLRVVEENLVLDGLRLINRKIS